MFGVAILIVARIGLRRLLKMIKEDNLGDTNKF